MLVTTVDVGRRLRDAEAFEAPDAVAYTRPIFYIGPQRYGVLMRTRRVKRPLVHPATHSRRRPPG